MDALRPFDHLKADLPPGPSRPQPGGEVACIGLIGPDTPQPGALVPHACEQAFGGHAVLPVGPRDDHGE